MSFYSRLFRKSPSFLQSPASASKPARSTKADEALPKPSAAERALAAAAEESALHAAIDARDAQAVARLVVAGSSTKVRQMAAHAIEDPDVLRQLIRDVRGGNDKGVYKVLTSKRDRELELTRKLEQSRAEIDEVSEAIERHSQRAYDALYRSTLHQYGNRWQAVAAEADPEMRGKVQHWIEHSQETVAEHLRQVAAQASSDLAAAHAAEEALRVREQEMRESLTAVAEQAQVLEDQKRALTKRQHDEQQPVRQIAELIRKARGALSDGSTSRAASVRQAIEEKRLVAPPLPANLESQIQQLDKQLDELKDWKSFSVAPKIVELIEAMESLIGAPFDPLSLADKIKNLQDEWRAVGKGVGENLDADGQRFKEAAGKAYQPCKEYFAAQALVRKENLRRREAVLAGLMAFEAETNWERPDWRTVIGTLRDAKQEWRRHSPVDSRAAGQQKEGFEALTAGLQGRLHAEYARNQAQKESLIERARQLLTSEDSRKSIDAIKELQQKWQAVGPVPRDADQRLWGEFRQHCDAVFQRREQESATYTAGLENNKAKAIAVCEQIEKISALDGYELLERTRALDELRSAFEELGQFPRADTRELRSRFDRGLERCKDSVARQHARDAERGWSDLFEAGNHVRAYSLAVARSLDAEQLDTLKSAAETYIASIQRWPKHGLESLKQRLAAGRASDLPANEATLKLLCIRAEILADIPTPSEDQPMRREYQLQSLVQRMGQGVRADETQWDGLAIEWVGVGPVDEAAYRILQQRFWRCRERGSARVASNAA